MFCFTSIGLKSIDSYKTFLKGKSEYMILNVVCCEWKRAKGKRKMLINTIKYETVETLEVT